MAAALGSMQFCPHAKVETIGKVCLWLGIIGMTALAWTRHRRKERVEADDREHALRGAICVIHSIARGDDTRNDGQLRTTLWAIDHDAELATQRVDYVGTSRTRGKNRTMNIRSGVVGKAVRTGEVCVFSRPNRQTAQEYVELMRDEQGMMSAEAADLDTDRRWFMGIPIQGAKGVVIGVVYMDATRRTFISKPQINRVILACSGLSDFVRSAEGGQHG